MLFRSTGNVGVGTSTPLALFEVSTTTVDWPSGVRPLMRVATKTTEALYVGADGNVGIGTTAPSIKLHVVQSGVSDVPAFVDRYSNDNGASSIVMRKARGTVSSPSAVQ